MAIWKAICWFISDVCWVIGAERLALKFLLMSLETTDVTAPIVAMHNTPPGTVPVGPWDMEVIFEDKKLVEELGDLRTNDIKIPKHIHDIN
jgi:hypothetical protein